MTNPGLVSDRNNRRLDIITVILVPLILIFYGFLLLPWLLVKAWERIIKRR